MSSFYIWGAVFLLCIGISAGCYIKAGTFARVKPGEHDPARIWALASLCWLVAALVVLVGLVVGAARQEPGRGVREVGWIEQTSPS